MPPPHQTAIQLQTLNSSNNNIKYTIPFESSSDDDEETQYKKRPFTNNASSSHNHEDLFELPPLSTTVTVSDILFNGVVLIIVFVNLFTDFTLICYHYAEKDYWASALTAGCVVSGGIGLIGQFWGVTYDQLDRIYNRGKCVRIVVNSFPWMATVITSYQTLSTAVQSRSNPMITRTYVKLQELSQSFLRVQGFAQGAPQAVVQLVVLLEESGDVGWMKAVLLGTSIITSLTIIMISNLPLKTDQPVENSRPKPAVYNPCTRVFIGLRMVSSFASRTLSLAVLFATCRCAIPQLIPDSTPFISHAIPLSFLLLPRLVMTVTEYALSKLSKHTTATSPQKFGDILISYIATVFIHFSDPAWVFWYVSVETVCFVVFGVVIEGVLGSECLPISVGVVCLVVFVFLFWVVPCAVPVIRRFLKRRR